MTNPRTWWRLSLVLLALLTVGLTGVSAALEVQVWPAKLCVKPGEALPIQVTVKGLPAGQTAAVDCQVRRGLGVSAGHFTGTTDAQGLVGFTFTPQEEFGYEVEAVASAGGEQARASEFFACGRNPYHVSVDYGGASVQGQVDVDKDGNPYPPGPPQSPWIQTLIAEQVKKARDTYCNVVESNPAYCSFAPMVPPAPNYYIGGPYFFSANGWRELYRDLHANGIVSVVYTSIFLTGMGGSDFARQHPEYVTFNRDGSPAGEIDTRSTAAFRDYYARYPESLKGVMERYKWWEPGLLGPYADMTCVRVNCQDLAAVKLGVESVLAGQKYFGFDGVRFDGHYAVPSLGDPLSPVAMVMDYQGQAQMTGAKADELTGRNMRYALGSFRQQDPNFMCGFNWASLRPDMADESILKTAEAQAILPGSWVLDEVAKGSLESASPTNRWDKFIPLMTVQSDRARQAGAFLCAGWGGGPGQQDVDMRYIKAISWACGLRWRAGIDRNFAPSYRTYNQFAYRYSEFLLSNERTRLSAEQAQAGLSVAASRPLLWQDFAYRLDTPRGRFLILHLVNTPLEPIITTTAVAPPPADQIRVTCQASLFPGGQPRWAEARLLSPDATPWEQPVKAATTGGQTVLSLPALPFWGVLVIPY
ncbi:MAG TPA: hypothetical protein VGM19_09770 [Armatimonadota bacterium]|jgi:hypothetical protein